MSAQITVATSDGRSFVRPVDRDEFTVGRDSRNNLVLGDRQVSKFHCKILRREALHVVQDLGSSNGTLINGIRVGNETVVTTGDRIRVGPYELIFADEGADASGFVRPPRDSVDAPPPTPAVVSPPGSPVQDELPELELEDLDPLGGGFGSSDAPDTPGAPRAVQLADPAPTPVRAAGPDRPMSDSGVTPAGSRAYLEIIDGDGKGHMITIGNRGVTIGAGSRNHLVLDDPFVSRQHCRVDRSDSSYSVRDMGSTNGIRVDGEDVSEAPMTDGTRLQVGGVLMVFRWPDKPEDAQALQNVPPARARPMPGAIPGETPTSPGAPVPMQRQGRTTATVRQMEALSESAVHNLGPHTSRSAKKDTPRGVVVLAGLQFRKWQLALLALFGVVIVLAVLIQAGLYAFTRTRGPQGPTSADVFATGTTFYDSGDLDTAASYFEQLPVDAAEYEDAQKYLDSIRVEKENADRVDRIAILMKEYAYSSEPGFLQRAYEIYKEIPATSRYFAEADGMVKEPALADAQRLRDEAASHLASGELEDAAAALERAAEYEPESAELQELREILAIDDKRKIKRAMKQRAAGTAEADPSTQASDSPRPSTPRSIQTVDKAMDKYLGGDVSGARSMLERAIDSSSDAAQKLELQDTLGRIDRIERAYSAGRKAMDAGELDTALDRFETSYRDITRMDSGGDSARRDSVRRALAECRYRRGREAFDRGKYARANFEWRSGRKAWPRHDDIQEGRDQLEMVAKDLYNDAYVAEKEGTERGREEAKRLYEQVIGVAPQGEGYAYYDKAQGRLGEL